MDDVLGVTSTLVFMAAIVLIGGTSQGPCGLKHILLQNSQELTSNRKQYHLDTAIRNFLRCNLKMDVFM
jgi:hypothetical protein